MGRDKWSVEHLRVERSSGTLSDTYWFDLLINGHPAGRSGVTITHDTELRLGDVTTDEDVLESLKLDHAVGAIRAKWETKQTPPPTETWISDFDEKELGRLAEVARRKKCALQSKTKPQRCCIAANAENVITSEECKIHCPRPDDNVVCANLIESVSQVAHTVGSGVAGVVLQRSTCRVGNNLNSRSGKEDVSLCSFGKRSCAVIIFETSQEDEKPLSLINNSVNIGSVTSSQVAINQGSDLADLSQSWNQTKATDDVIGMLKHALSPQELEPLRAELSAEKSKSEWGSKAASATIKVASILGPTLLSTILAACGFPGA